MVHKTPGTEKWELAMRGRQLWEIFAESILSVGLDPLEILGWKKTGNLFSRCNKMLYNYVIFKMFTYMFFRSFSCLVELVSCFWF